MFDHEKLEVYRLELRFISWITPFIEELRTENSPTTKELREQLDRASLSSLPNTAEGNSKRYKNLRSKYFDDARGSATECAACSDAAFAKGACNEDRISEGKAMLLRIVQMLTKLVQSNSQDGGYVKEEQTSYEIHYLLEEQPK